MFQFYTGNAPNILNEGCLLNAESSYSLRNQQTFVTRPIHAVHYASNSLSYLVPKIWEMVPSNTKNKRTVTAFKLVFKKVATRKLPL